MMCREEIYTLIMSMLMLSTRRIAHHGLIEGVVIGIGCGSGAFCKLRQRGHRLDLQGLLELSKKLPQLHYACRQMSLMQPFD